MSPATRSQPSRIVTGVKWSAGLTVIGASSALTYAYFFDEGVWRTIRVLSSLIPMAVDYWWLSYLVRGMPDEARRRAFDEYHQQWCDEPLRVCLDLRGFYVKVGQLCAGFPGDGLPLPYKESLKVLQEHVPPQPFARIKAIVEEELDCMLEDVFAEFEKDPIGAASIGQVWE
jgi:predicted unusual protein kinase regulating ubiquinone biosynthesis (AarF/ABC1/UbiB family)